MAKSNEVKTKPSELATVTGGGGGLALPPNGGAVIEGRDAAAAISRLALYQGTAEEEKMYGDGFKRGDFLDTLERRKLGQSVKVVPIAGWMSWAKFAPGQKAPVYSVRSRSEVPPGDLEWTGEGAAKKAPAAVETVNMILMVDGEPWPYLFMFKKTSLKAYTKHIEPMERRNGHSVYELSSEDDKNASGQPFKRLTARFVQRASAEQMALVNAIKAQITAVRAKAEAIAAHEPDDDLGVADEIPI